MGVYPDEAGSIDGALRWMERCPTVKGTEPEVHTPRTKTLCPTGIDPSGLSHPSGCSWILNPPPSTTGTLFFFVFLGLHPYSLGKFPG